MLFEHAIIRKKYQPPKRDADIIGTGTRIRTLIKGFGDLYSTIELFP